MGKMGSYLKLRVYHFNSVETEKKSGMKRHIPNLEDIFSFPFLMKG